MTATEHSLDIASPIGGLRLISNGHALTQLEFINSAGTPSNSSRCAILQQAAHQLDRYFNGCLTEFTVPLAPTGTHFQQHVWQQLQRLKFGQSSSYGQLAQAIGNPKAVRAVGGANNRNPIPIIIPCHRVIGQNGKLVGYGGGLALKTWLLRHEKIEFVDQT